MFLQSGCSRDSDLRYFKNLFYFLIALIISFQLFDKFENFVCHETESAPLWGMPEKTRNIFWCFFYTAGVLSNPFAGKDLLKVKFSIFHNFFDVIFVYHLKIQKNSVISHNCFQISFCDHAYMSCFSSFKFLYELYYCKVWIWFNIFTKKTSHGVTSEERGGWSSVWPLPIQLLGRLMFY